MNFISKLDPEKGDEEGTSALIDSLRKKCAVGIVESIVNQPDGVDVDEWMDSVYKPTAKGQLRKQSSEQRSSRGQKQRRQRTKSSKKESRHWRVKLSLRAPQEATDPER